MERQRRQPRQSEATASSPLKLIDFGLAGFAQQLRENAIEVGFGLMPKCRRVSKARKDYSIENGKMPGRQTLIGFNHVG